MSSLLNHINISNKQIFYREKNFDLLGKELETWNVNPTLSGFEEWIDLFFTYDKDWSDSLFEYHKNKPSDISRALLLFATFSQGLHIKQFSVNLSDKQIDILNDLVNSSYGLITPLSNNWLCFSYAIKALLQMFTGEDFSEQWLKHIDNELKNNKQEKWRSIFHASSTFALIGLDISEEDLESNLEYFDTDTFTWLEERVDFWRYLHGYYLTTAQLDSWKEKNCNSLQFLMMAKTSLMFNKIENAYIYLNNSRQTIEASQYRIWTDSTIKILEEYDPSSSWTLPVIMKGVDLSLPRALHWAAMRTQDDKHKLIALEKNLRKHYFPSVYSWIDVNLKLDPQANVKDWFIWLLTNQYSPALYDLMIKTKNFDEQISIATDLIEQAYPPAMFFVATKILNKEWFFNTEINTWEKLEYNSNIIIDLELALDFLDSACEQYYLPALDLFMQFKYTELTSTDFYTACNLICNNYPEWNIKAFERSIVIQNDEYTIYWGEKSLKLDLSDEQRKNILFELGSILILNKKENGRSYLEEAATLGHDTAIEWLADENKIYRKKHELKLEENIFTKVQKFLGFDFFKKNK